MVFSKCGIKDKRIIFRKITLVNFVSQKFYQNTKNTQFFMTFNQKLLHNVTEALIEGVNYFILLPRSETTKGASVSNPYLVAKIYGIPPASL